MTALPPMALRARNGAVSSPADIPSTGTPSAAIRWAGRTAEGLQARLGPSLGALRLPWPAALYILCMVTPLWFNAGPLVMSLLRLFLLVMVIPIAIRLLAGKYGRLIATDVLFGLHLIWMTVALTVNNPAQVIGQTGSVGVEFLGGYLVGRAYVRTPEAFLALCRWLIVIVFCLAPFAVIETLTYRVPIIEAIRALPFFNSVELIRYDKRIGLYRAQVVFAHPIHFGLFCSVAFSLAFVALRGVISTTQRWVATAIVGATGFLALSSGAFLAILLQIALIAWAAAFNRLRWRWWLLVGLFALAYVAIDILSSRSPSRVFMTYATFSAHNAYWRATIFEWGMKNVWSSPIFGIGLNDWFRPEWMYITSVDNFWLLMAMRYGIPGFLLLAIGYAWAIFLIMRRDFTADAVLSQIRRAWVFTFLGLTFTLVTVHVWTSIYSFVFFLFGAGIWLIAAQPAAPADPGRDPGSSTSAGAPDAPPVPARRGPRYSRFPAAPPRRRAAPA